jgi:SM-20-related protein
MDYEKLIENLIERGYFIQESFLNEELCSKIIAEGELLPLKKAKIGKGAKEISSDEIRNDFIYWLEENSEGIWAQAYLSEVEELRLAINRHLYLGLKQFEGHFARYEEGGFYKKHLDQFQGNNERQISLITYLNTPLSGGQLRLYKRDHPDEIECDVTPKAGMLVCFLSNQIYHEVLPTSSKRYSLTGWLRTNIK